MVNTQSSWKLRPLFIVCMALSCCSVIALWPLLKEGAIFLPVVALGALFVLPNLLWPHHIRLVIGDSGVSYTDFSQQIYAPWSFVTGYRYTSAHRIDVYVQPPRASFSVRLSHPDVERLKEKLQQHAKPVV